MNENVSLAGASTCRDCGRWVEHKPNGGPHRWHACRWRWHARQTWRAHQDGWHSGYRFAVKNADDPLVLADADDYGTGWAGHMRVGHLTIAPRTGADQ